MASISRGPNGRRRIQFSGPDGKRQTLRLGKVSYRTAEGFKTRVEQILESKRTGQPLESDTAAWVAKLKTVMAEKLAGVGLIPSRENPTVTTLGPFLTEYVAGRADLKPATKIVRGQARSAVTADF